MIRIGICDDEESVRDSLRFQLEKILDEKNEEIVYEFSDGSTASSWVLKHPGEIDLLFLDVEMKNLSGMEAAKLIRKQDKNISFAFVTGYSDYVYEGYEVEAMGYFIKPITLPQLEQLMNRVRKKLNVSDISVTYTFKNSDGTYRIPKSDILYFESDKRQIHIFTENQKYTIYGKLDEIQAEFENDGFVRIHNRYLVNGKSVSRISTEEVTVGNISLPFSRSHKKEAYATLARNILKD